MPSKTSVSWKQVRMVECGFLRALTSRQNRGLYLNDYGVRIRT
ncbi:hypothetical protein EV03_0685 [Prochlorococcus marinus str. PAC1]|uniref:Uncharacterized protein n=1 Tax=Prochlorococcus marinus str. PAC1 TaxID=59924 RepID=A0A0A2C6P9_PROMR|nr:hypothetical protein EV03_0685 [Prochlorococcus marinus str. PAC1]